MVASSLGLSGEGASEQMGLQPQLPVSCGLVWAAASQAALHLCLGGRAGLGFPGGFTLGMGLGVPGPSVKTSGGVS